MIILLLGVDGSGKTTTLELLAKRGWSIIELSAEPEAVEWKKRGTREPITPDFVNEREKDFLKINDKYSDKILELVGGAGSVGGASGADGSASGADGGAADGKAREYNAAGAIKVATSQHELVTYLAHEIMRAHTVPGYVPRVEPHVWMASSMVKPDAIFIQYAPREVITERFECRVAANPIECSVGFNSLDFLMDYQKHLLALVPQIRELGITSEAFDSSELSPREIVGRITKSL